MNPCSGPLHIDAHFTDCMVIEKFEAAATVHEDSREVESINDWVEDQCG